MIALQYRLHELYDDKTRRALIDDMLTHYAADPDLVAFLRAVDNAVGAASDDAQEEIDELRAELSGAQDEMNAMEITIDELRADLDYWKGRAAHD